MVTNTAGTSIWAGETWPFALHPDRRILLSGDMIMPLNEQRILFAHEYVRTGFNATQAAKNAGYSPKTSYILGHRLLQDPETWAYIQGLTEDLLQKAHLDSESLLNIISHRATIDAQELFEDDGSLKRMKDIPEEVRRCIQSIEVVELFQGKGNDKHAIGLLKKVKLTDKDKNTELLAKYHGLLKEKVEHSGAVNFTISREEENI